MKNNTIEYISIPLLLKYGIREKTIEMWRYRRIVSTKEVDNEIYILYDSIPNPSKIKLPSKEAITKEIRRKKDNESIDFSMIFYLKPKTIIFHYTGKFMRSISMM